MSVRIPSYRFHKARDLAVVTLNGKDHYLGKYNSPESREAYDRLIAEWLVGRHRPAATFAGAAADFSVNELCLAYWRYVERHYVKDGKPTSEQDAVRHALRFIRKLYGNTAAKEFGPLALKTVREEMIRHPITRKRKVRDPETGQIREEVRVVHQGLARRVINKQIGRIRRMFAWAVEEELLPVEAYQALLCVKGLKKGKSEAREKSRVGPVPEAFVEAVLPLVPPTVATMIRVQLLTGARPQDVVNLRAIDIDMTGPVWEYRPRHYKTEHRNDDDSPDRERVVFLGPKAQALLKPYLTLNVTDYLFSPARSEGERNARRRQGRKTPLWPSHARRYERKGRRRRAPLRERYDVASYRRAIRRACLKAGVPVWAPNQLRHARGTEIRRRYGLEASQAVLGHAELGVTQVYAEVDRETARRVMLEVG